MRGRAGLIALVAVLALPTGAVAAVWLWGRPRESVALPGPSSTPVAVVRTYVRALDERDFATSNALQPYGGDSHWWTPNGPTITHLHITAAAKVGSGAHLDVVGASRWKYGVEVDTIAVFHNFSGLSGGSQPWGYDLVRNSEKKPWKVLDWGQG